MIKCQPPAILRTSGTSAFLNKAVRLSAILFLMLSMCNQVLAGVNSYMELSARGIRSASANLVPVVTVLKTGSATAIAGGAISYVIEVGNTGLSNASNLLIEDDIPDQVVNVAWQAEAIGGGTITGASSGMGNGISLHGNIPAGSGNKIRITVTGIVHPSFVGTLSNIAKATPSEPGIPAVSSAPVQTLVTQKPVIVATISGPATATAGTTISYFIELSNTGLSNANNMLITDIVPPELTDVTWTTNTEGLGVVISGQTGSGNNVSLVGRINAGTANKIQIAITGKVNASFGGTLFNSVTVTPSEAGNLPVTTPAVQTVVELHPVIAITKTGPATATAGSEITYTIEVTNGCLSNAKDLLITDFVSLHLTNVSWTTAVTGTAVVKTGITGTGNTITITADIRSCPGNKIIITVKGTIDPSFAGIIINTATATPSEPGNPPVVSPPVETLVRRAPSLSVTKAGPAKLKSGDRITYVIEVSNSSLSNAENLTITDVISSEITNVEWSAIVSGAAKINTGITGNGNHLNITADLPAGIVNKIVITVNGFISKSFVGIIVNAASAAASEDGVPVAQSNIVETIVDYADFIIPNIVTPNGDGSNDVLKIKGIENYLDTEIFIVNRWGNEVYRSNDYKNDWDGSQLNEGTYYYVVKRREKTGGLTTFKGWVFLKR
ncbi:gliding motility-associated C-terminal domain-containing protein [Pedobacter frigoris]|uniref:T9SS type B sorting domain-containing protein n=1 Tax=Pedobacter frigoris TaxID=2571272 RepID=UPI00292F4EFA|nr:gliding motility-associated C-terminal domain-containing protein [Pedobacter frigoris]